MQNANQNRLFVGFKPPNISSNRYLQYIKKRFHLQKIGYSGTLDPFASGVLVIASGAYTKLLHHINISPKVYVATLWLGASSPSFDISNINNINVLKEFRLDSIKEVLDSLIGNVQYTPPVFSAKKVGGIRAYKLARKGKEVKLAESNMRIFDVELLHYIHPFLRFKVSVDKGGYVRSIGDLIAKKLGVCGALSALKRISEGDFIFNDYATLSPLSFLPYKQIQLDSHYDDIRYGRKITLNQIDIQKNTRYIVVFDDFFSIIEINNASEVKYILNNIEVDCK